MAATVEWHVEFLQTDANDDNLRISQTLTNVFDLSLCLVTTLQVQIRFAYY